MSRTADGKPYYKNHHLRTTQWHHPLQTRESQPRPPAAPSNTNTAASLAAANTSRTSTTSPPPRPQKAAAAIAAIGGVTSMFSGLLAKKEAPKFEIGAPTNFQHITHVKYVNFIFTCQVFYIYFFKDHI